jgi:hypothetical protein
VINAEGEGGEEEVMRVRCVSQTAHGHKDNGRGDTRGEDTTSDTSHHDDRHGQVNIT